MSDVYQKRMDIYPCDGLGYFLTDGPDLISQYLREGQTWDSCCLTVSKALIKDVQNPVLVDIGANLGAWTLPMGAHIKAAGGVVHAFEPQRPVFYQLCANILNNDLMHCHAHHLAIGDFTGHVDIPFLDVFSCTNLGALSLSEDIRTQQGWNFQNEIKEQVRISTLDDLQLPQADLIKIDVEGLELEVLKGGKNWLKQSGNPPILLEVWGDYMTGMVEKRDRLLHLLEQDLEYALTFHGELCVAQHRDRKGLSTVD